MRKRCVAFLWMSCVLVLPLRAQDLREPALLPWSQQIAVREAWLHKRHALLLPMMRAHGIGMWIVVNEEFHDDPLTEFVAPPRPYAGNRDIFVFVDAGQAGLRRLAITGYAEEALKAFFESPDDPAPPDKALADLWARFKPEKIALGFGGRRGVQRSLTKDTYEFLAAHMGPEAASRFVPAADLIEEYLDTRIPEEFETYTALVQLTDVLTRRAFSNEVIVPGRTTVGDVRRWLFDALGARGVRTWFQPDLRVQRKGTSGATSRGFLAVAPESTVIERGDVLHVDFGITYMGLNSDWQKMAYVLREREPDVPAGLKQAMAHTNALQDAVMRAARPGRTGGEVYQLAMDEMSASRHRGEDLLAPHRQPGPRPRCQHRLPSRPARRHRRHACVTRAQGLLHVDRAQHGHARARVGWSEGVRDDGGRCVPDRRGIPVLPAPPGGVVCRPIAPALQTVGEQIGRPY